MVNVNLLLTLQASQIQEMESQINHISQTVAIHKEKVRTILKPVPGK